MTAWLASLVLGPVRDAPAAVMAVSAAAGAVGANLFNNLPAAFVLADAVHGSGLSATSVHAAAIGTIIGADLGPNLTPVGSVATLLWFVLLRQRGLEVSTWSCIRVGLIVTPVTILAALAAGLVLGVPRNQEPPRPAAGEARGRAGERLEQATSLRDRRRARSGPRRRAGRSSGRPRSSQRRPAQRARRAP